MRFRHVRLTVQDPETLIADLDYCYGILTKDDRFRHVRQVSVTGGMNYLWREFSSVHRPDYFFHWETSSEYNRYEPATEDSFAYEVDSGDENDDLATDAVFIVRTCPDKIPRGLTPQQRQAQEKRAERSAWIPFADFLAWLPVLHDLVYACSNQVPRCVLEALHKHHPQSRLHVSTFHLRSFARRLDDHDREVDPDEYALVTSPCLYSIHLSGREEVKDPDDWYGPEIPISSFDEVAVLSMLKAGFAPRLRHVHVPLVRMSASNESPTILPLLKQALSRPLAPWRGIFRDQDAGLPTATQQPSTTPSILSTPPPQLAQLETLAFTSDYNSDLDRLLVWAACVDFAALRRLDLQSGVSERMLQIFIIEATQPTSSSRWFSSLRSLSLRPSYPYLVKEGASSDHLVTQFLSVLPPLERLDLDGSPSARHILETILSRHGRTLRTLRLPTCGEKDNIDHDQVRDIARRCPCLQDIRLRIRRRRGTREEVAIYRAIGQIRRLRCVKLVLDCLGDYDEDLFCQARRWDQDDSQLTPEAVESICKTMVNFAVDMDLVGRIWVAITGTEELIRTGEGALPLPLETLIVVPGPFWDDDWVVWGDYGELSTWAEFVGVRWLCKRRQDSVSQLDIREIVNPDRPRSNILMTKIKDREGSDVWSKIWPRKGKWWADDWHSFPLEMDEDDAMDKKDGVEA
ncbi:hypothetical protein VTJ49DRAFT_1094 [Mycothermus thermophilus]|uniref:Uncharacterized protein n=1 Tax=Humicola insolens TaxID=85995 RepID=A0ABR3VDW3_HUMIN